jgi:hypothetical protein
MFARRTYVCDFLAFSLFDLIIFIIIYMYIVVISARKTVAYLLLPQWKKVFWCPCDKYSIVNYKLRIVVNAFKSRHMGII